jgi:hypothetical protein
MEIQTMPDASATTVLLAQLVNGPLPLSRASTHNILEVFRMVG